ncbi:MAG: GtrA family protein [Clostridiales bacterium]|nr:GtrA family protein [Clostridiales bacterium]
MNEFFQALKNKRARREYFKSILVGAASTLLDFLVTALILYLAYHEHYDGFMGVFTGKLKADVVHPTVPAISIYITATVLSFIVSILFNYIMSIFFVYEYGNVGKNTKGFTKFAIFALIGLTITTVSSVICSQVFGLSGSNVWWIKIAIAVLVFIFNFFTRKYFVFNIALIRDDENTINL